MGLPSGDPNVLGKGRICSRHRSVVQEVQQIVEECYIDRTKYLWKVFCSIANFLFSSLTYVGLSFLTNAGTNHKQFNSTTEVQ